MQSVFTDKKKIPTTTELKKALDKTFDIWQLLAEFTRKCFPSVKEEWNFSGKKYGWSFRMRDKKRVLVYLLPRDKFFKIAFVFGSGATNQIFASNISQSIKDVLSAAKVYAEGRGIRLEVKDSTKLNDLKKLIEIKIGTK